MHRYIQKVPCSLCKATMPCAINPDLPSQPSAICLACRYRQAAQLALPLEGCVPEGRFSLGSVHWGRASLRSLKAPVAREMLARHAAGDFGAIGRLDQCTTDRIDLEEAAAWPLLADRLKRNVVGVCTGQGDIHSSFLVPLGEEGSRGVVPFTVATCPSAGLTLLFSTELGGDARI